MDDGAPSPLPHVYHGYGGRLCHRVPEWVRTDAIFHIRVRCTPEGKLLTDPKIAPTLLDSVRLYHERQRWWSHLFLIMPDHWHALLSFPLGLKMSRVIGDWKKYHSRHTGIVWQEGFFDHRLRAHLEQLEAKVAYIRQNPVLAGYCVQEADWPWQWQADSGPPDTHPET